jgi:hypothetical protein
MLPAAVCHYYLKAVGLVRVVTATVTVSVLYTLMLAEVLPLCG